MHVAGSGLHQPTAQSRIFERLFDVHSEAEDLSALSFFGVLHIWISTGKLFWHEHGFDDAVDYCSNLL